MPIVITSTLNACPHPTDTYPGPIFVNWPPQYLFCSYFTDLYRQGTCTKDALPPILAIMIFLHHSVESIYQNSLESSLACGQLLALD